MDYKIVLSRGAEEDLDGFVAYLLFEKKSEQAARNLLNDFEATKTSLSNVAGSLKLCDNPKLRELGYYRINFLSHRYFMLYRIENDTVYVDNIFHELQDYENKLKSGEYDAIILAAAGLKRLGLDNDKELDYIYPDEEKFISAAGQGILAIECRNGDLKDVMAALDDRKARICLEAEREFLKCLDGSCNAPCSLYGG